MNIPLVGVARSTVNLAVQNDEASATISKGLLCVLKIDGADDGFDVVLPASAGAQVNSLPFGVALKDIPAQSKGEVQAFGFNGYSILRRATRAATTDSWASQASLDLGHVLAVDTVNNCFSTAIASLGASGFLPFAVLGESLASFASSASATSDARTAITAATKAFLRML